MTKKFLLSFVLVGTLLFGLCFNASAQDKKFRFGPKAGLNISNMISKYKEDGNDSWKKDTDRKSLIGFHVGIAAEYNINEWIGIQPALLFSTKGYKFDTKNDKGKDVTATYRLNYIDLPINIVGKYAINDGISVFAHVGPSFSFGLGGKVKCDGDSESRPFGDGEKDNGLKAFAIGADMGAGVELMESLQIDIHYDLGLTNIAQKPDNSKVKNGVFMLSVGWMF